MSKKILVIEDDADIVEILKSNLSSYGFAVESAMDGLMGLQRAQAERYDLVLLDIMLPKMDGLEVCKKIREAYPDIHIIMLTGRSSETDKVVGLELGADDYMTKPFGVSELIARIKAVFRKEESLKAMFESQPEQLRFGGLEIYPDFRRVVLDGEELSLTAMEFDLLFFLASNPGRPFTREQLARQVWDYRASGHEGTVSAQLSRLRKRIEKDMSNPKFLKTVWGIGYQFARPEEFH